MRYSASLVLLPIVLLASPRSSDAEKRHAPRPPHPPYSLIRGTSSPSHEYAIAWGIKGHNVNWNWVENSARDPANSYLMGLLSHEGNLQNYIVDKRAKRILGIIPLHHRSFHHKWDGPRKLLRFTAGGDYWAGAGNCKNHADVSTYWLRDESMGMLLYDNKWWYDAIYIAENIDSKFRVTEVGDAAESYLRRYLDRTRHRAYQAAHTADERNPTIEAGNFRLAQKSLTMDVRAYIPKTWDNPAAFRYYGTMRLNLTRGRTGLTARVFSLKKRLRKSNED